MVCITFKSEILVQVVYYWNPSWMCSVWCFFSSKSVLKMLMWHVSFMSYLKIWHSVRCFWLFLAHLSSAFWWPSAVQLSMNISQFFFTSDMINFHIHLQGIHPYTGPSTKKWFSIGSLNYPVKKINTQFYISLEPHGDQI